MIFTFDLWEGHKYRQWDRFILQEKDEEIKHHQRFDSSALIEIY